jgi:hypothetical protein
LLPVVAAPVLEEKPVASEGVPEPGLKGLEDGVGRDVFSARDGGVEVPLPNPDGENLEGNVPARVLLVFI